MPQTRTAASPGQTLDLVAHFYDSGGDLATVSGVQTLIFDPSGDINTDATALTTLTPTSTHTGIYVSSYSIPLDATNGSWCDKWKGYVDGQLLEQVFGFEVTISGVIQTTILQNNNVITVTLDKDIAATDGDTLEEDYQFYFTTEYSPTYTNYNQILLEIGRFVTNIPPDTVWRAILSASLEADLYNRGTPGTTDKTDWFQFARRMWTRCRTQEIVLVEALQEFSVKRKRLADLDVTFDTEGINTALDRALACQQKWIPGLESGGIKVKKMQTFIKGDLDPDKPAFGRDYIPPDQSNDPYHPGVPAANNRYPTYYYRRYMKGYKRRKW